ncbi:Gpi inositol deacylase pgap1 [Nesidiocoris tenuis]|nr:Gpi inositol deacylase pgap1 [Nesidiocoris tenuis]
MTYMYEYPQLVRISLPANVTNTYPKYGLYAYGEGRLIQKIRSMRFTGIPVLFIPGNRGSPNQVRSIASVALRKHLKDKTPFYFDFFALDLNEEYSGLFGGFLRDQTKFAASAIEKILSLYKSDNGPDSVIIISHSMGGLIAKGLFLESNFNPDKVKVIVTLATPHSPIALLDTYLNEYYSRVNSYWDTFQRANMTVVTVGGGPRDLLVMSGLTSSPHADISVITSEIPGVWLSTDHSCILWCNELVLVMVRAFFESVDYQTKQITNDAEMRLKIFKYHFLERSGTKRYYRNIYPDQLPLWGSYRGESHWIPVNTTSFSWDRKTVMKPSHLTVALRTAADMLAIDAFNHETRDWIFACTVDPSVTHMRVCKTGINLSGKARIFPHYSGGKRKFAMIDLSKLRMGGFTHVVVRTLPSNEKVTINMELVMTRSRTLSGATGYLPRSTLVPKTEPDSLYYAVEMPSLVKPWHTYRLHVAPLNCTLKTSGAVVSVAVPWSHEGSTTLINEAAASAPIVIYDSKPSGKDVGNVKAHILLKPDCAYSIRLEYSFWLSAGAVFAKMGVNVICYIAVCLLLVLSYQLKVLQEESSCPLLQLSMPAAAKPYVVIQATALVSAVVQHVSPYVPLLPTTDIQSHAGFVEMLVIPLVLYMSAFAIVYLAGIAMIVCIVFQGQAYNNILLRFLNRFFFGLIWLSEWAMSGANKVPVVVSAFMVTVAYTACGGLALVIGLGFYFFKMVSLYEDFWEEIVYWPLRVIKAKLKQRKDKNVAIPKFQIPPVDEFSFHLTLLMLWTLTTILHLPSVLTWAKNYRYNNKLEPDPGFVNGVILSICVGYLWQAEVPKSGLAGSKYLSKAVFTAAVLAMTFAQTTLYRLPIIVSGVFICVTLHQLIAPWFTEEEEPIPQLVDATGAPIGDFKTQLADMFQASSLSSLGLGSGLGRYLSLISSLDLGYFGGSPVDPPLLQAIEEPSSSASDLPAGDDRTDDADSVSDDDDDDDGGKGDAVGQSGGKSADQEGNGTPSSDASTSSFEQISEREIAS